MHIYIYRIKTETKVKSNLSFWIEISSTHTDFNFKILTFTVSSRLTGLTDKSKIMALVNSWTVSRSEPRNWKYI